VSLDRIKAGRLLAFREPAAQLARGCRIVLSRLFNRCSF